MFLDSVILKNFKSFSGKTVLDFPSKITAIVGPNGSGKSNIADAIRWALGEQAFRNIRIEKGEDLIFASQKESSGFAEAELIFNNQPKIFPLDFSEISILRRIDREGNNNYFLNHKSCRLRDVIEASASAKIGVRGLSIVNQGAVENVLRVSPEERRIMLEENLGLKGLEIKKEEARRKLEETFLNLDKTQTLLDEIIPHLRSLKRQVSRWEKREKIKEELIQLETKYFGNIYHQIVSERMGRADFNRVKEKAAFLEKEIQEKEKNLGLLKNENGYDLEKTIQDITREIISLEEKKSSLLWELGKKEGGGGLSLSGKLLEEKIITIKSQLKSALGLANLDEIKEKIKAAVGELDLIFSSKEEKQKEELEEIKAKIKEIEEKIAVKKNILKESQEELNKRNLDFHKRFQEISALRSERESYLREIQKEELTFEKHRLRLEDLQRRLEEAGYNLSKIESFCKGNINDILISQNELLLLERQILRLKREITEIGLVDEGIMVEYKELTERHEFLLSQTNDLKKGAEDLKTLIKELSNQIEKTFNESLLSINREFSRYFHLMFNGGSAKLIEIKKTIEAENGVNGPLDREYWGVEIKVDIPKTKLKNLEMLSGGEKSLVAICLIFSIVNQASPPLLVVDEIDAALDEENSRRFGEILKELSKTTQFIIITHNRITMAIVEVIYGVTLSANGNSQLLSIKFEEAETFAK